MSENSYKLYMHTSPSSKIYFGITSMSVEKRWRNGRGYPTNEYFTNAINKYGWDNIEHLVLADNLTKEEACHYEEVLIAYFDTMNPSKGYNHRSGGECNQFSEETKQRISESLKGENSPMYGKPKSEETRRKLSEANTGYKHTEEAKRKNRDAHIGKKHTDESKRKMSEALKGRPVSEETKAKLSESHKNKNVKKVKCIETGIIYASRGDANEALGKPRYRAEIGKCARGEMKTAFGCRWEYIEE